MPKHHDIFTPNMFSENQEPTDDNGLKNAALENNRIVDKAGNEYEIDTLNLAKEAPSEGLLKARKIHPDWSDRELATLAIILNAQLKTRKK